MKPGRSAIHRQTRVLPTLRFEDQQLTSFSGLVICPRKQSRPGRRPNRYLQCGHPALSQDRPIAVPALGAAQPRCGVAHSRTLCGPHPLHPQRGTVGFKDPKPIMRRLLSAAKAEEQRSAKPSSAVSLFKKGRKQYAYVQNRPNGAVTVTIEPGLKAAAGDDLEAVMKRIEKTLRRALG